MLSHYHGDTIALELVTNFLTVLSARDSSFKKRRRHARARGVILFLTLKPSSDAKLI